MSSAWKNVGMATIRTLIRTEIRTPAVDSCFRSKQNEDKTEGKRTRKTKEGVKKGKRTRKTEGRGEKRTADKKD